MKEQQARCLDCGQRHSEEDPCPGRPNLTGYPLEFETQIPHAGVGDEELGYGHGV